MSVKRSSFLVLMVGLGRSWFDLRLEVADADGAVGVEAEDFVEGIDHRRGRRDDRAADDGHLALVNIAAPDGEAAVDDGGDAEDEAEHHDHGETVADAGFQVGGTEGRALGESGDGVEGEQGGDGEERAQTRAEFSERVFFSYHCLCVHSFLFLLAAHAANHAQSFSNSPNLFCVIFTQNEKMFPAGWKHE